MGNRLPDECVDVFNRHLKWRYNLGDPSDIETCAARGYWRIKAGCPGGTRCKHAFASVLGPCDGTMDLTIDFDEPGIRDSTGRFISPYRIWRMWRDNEQSNALAQ